jgi:hypothetical protein
MLKKSLFIAVASISMLGAAPAIAQGIGHTWFMRGTIVGTDKTGTVVCIGKADGAEVGQTLNVYRAVYHPGPNKGQARPTTGRISVMFGSITSSMITLLTSRLWTATRSRTISLS